MKKTLLIALSLFTLLMFAACSNTVADVSTAAGGEVKVTESHVGTMEETIDPEDGAPVTGEADYESYTVTYTDPEGYTVTEEGGGSVTFSLDGYEVGKIVYVPATVVQASLDAFNAALAADAEALKEYAAEFAEGLDVNYEVTKQDVNGQEAILITGTVAEGSTYGNPGDVAYVLVMPMNNQMIVLRGFADAETADQIRADLTALAESMKSEQGTSGAASTATSTAASAAASMATSVATASAPS